MLLAAYLGTEGCEIPDRYPQIPELLTPERRKIVVQVRAGSGGSKSHGGRGLFQIAASLGPLECGSGYICLNSWKVQKRKGFLDSRRCAT